MPENLEQITSELLEGVSSVLEKTSWQHRTQSNDTFFMFMRIQSLAPHLHVGLEPIPVRCLGFGPMIDVGRPNRDEEQTREKLVSQQVSRRRDQSLLREEHEEKSRSDALEMARQAEELALTEAGYTLCR